MREVFQIKRKKHEIILSTINYLSIINRMKKFVVTAKNQE